MSAAAIERALAKSRAHPARHRPPLRLVHDVDRPTVVSKPRPRVASRIGSAINRAFAFTFIVVACVSLFWAGAGLGKFEDDLEIRQHVSAIMADDGLPPMLQQIGTFNRERGQ